MYMTEQEVIEKLLTRANQEIAKATVSGIQLKEQLDSLQAEYTEVVEAKKSDAKEYATSIQLFQKQIDELTANSDRDTKAAKVIIDKLNSRLDRMHNLDLKLVIALTMGIPVSQVPEVPVDIMSRAERQAKLLPEL